GKVPSLYPKWPRRSLASIHGENGSRRHAGCRTMRSDNRSRRFARKPSARRSAHLRPVSWVRKFPRSVSASRSVLGPCLGRFADPHGGYFRPARMAPLKKVPGEGFSRALIMAQNVVQMAMVKTIIDIALERRQLMIVANKAVLVEIGSREFDLNDIVVPVQAGALMVFRQAGQLMRCGEMKFLGNAKQNGRAEGRGKGE